MKFIAAAIALAGIASAATAPRTAGQDICCAANADRAKQGLKPYKWFPDLDYIAQKHSEYMLSVGDITHEEKPGTTTYQLADRLSTVSFVFKTAGENVANGYDDLWATQQAWMKSPGHRANIMSTSFTVCGGGVADPGRYFTADFASPMDVEDDTKYYTLQCSNGVSMGAYTSDSAPHVHAPLAPAAPISEAIKSPVPLAASESKTASKKVVATTTPPKVENVAETSSAEAAPSPAPAVPTTPGKCKRVPKGSIAAGKCKPCKKCAANSSPFRR